MIDPQDDPEFWDRPAGEPEYLRNARGTPDPESYFPLLFRRGHLMYRGNTAINLKTKTIYEYDPETGEWTKDDQS